MAGTVAIAQGGVPKRHILVALCFVATFICYIDRVNISVAIIPMAEQFGWSGTTKGLVLSSFFIGYMGAMIPTGWLANRIGGKLLLGFALVGWSVFTFLTPIAASLSFAMLIATRIAMGMGEAASFPAVYNLFARWLPPTERTRAVAFNLTGVALGTVFALSTTGWLVATRGWQSVFYVFGGAGLMFAVAWFWLVHSRPSAHPTISPEERAMLAPVEADGDSAGDHVPWARIFSHSAVWALIFNHFCGNWTLYLMLAWLPSYFRDAQHLSVTGSGIFAVGPWVSFFVVGNLGAALADRLITRGVDLTLVRKVFQIAGLLGSAACLLFASNATTPMSALATLCGALGLLGLTWSGFASNHLDLGPRYADVLFSISNTAGTLPGIVGVAATGFLLDLTGGYTATLIAAATVNVAGAIVWLIWGTGKRILD